MSELTDYEKERLKRIADNQALLQSLQLDAPVRAATPESKPKTKKPAARKPAPRKSAASSLYEELPARTTRSRAVRTSTLEQADPEAAKRKREEEEAQEEYNIQEKKRLKHGDREIETWNPTGKYEIPAATIPLKRRLESVVTSGSWPRELHSSIQPPAKKANKNGRSTPVTTGTSSRPTPTRRSSAKKLKKEESDDEDLSPVEAGSDAEDSKSSIGMKRLEDTFAHMSMRAVKRITPDRIYSAAVHPTTDRDLVFIGDRKGWLGIWDASTDSSEVSLQKEDDEEDEYDRHAFVQRVYHDHGTIACMRFDPLKAHSIYTSSYDCTIRSLNFEVGVWREEVDVDLLAADDEGAGESLISAFEVTHDGNQIWVSDNRGGATHQDLREPKHTARRWKVSDKKAGCIALNPANENYFATAHLDRDVRIWDVRKLVKLDYKTTSQEDIYDKACTAVYEHGKACTSAYWDPSGRHLLTTSYDNFVRVWDTDPKKLSEEDLGKFNPSREVKHDNQTGAYVSVFKATWCPNPNVEPFFTIGNMKRNVDIYSKEGKLVKQLKEQVETVPAVTAMHPSKPVVVAGAAGGKVYYWKADQWH